MTGKKLHFFIVDDDPVCVTLYRRLLEKEGHTSTAVRSSKNAIEELVKIQPDCILCDLLLPDLDGLQFFQKVKEESALKPTVFIIITSKEYQYDYRKAFELGVDGYLNKSLGAEAIIERVLQIVKKEIVVGFWGVRGTLPVPNKNTIRYGGNTSCIAIEFPNNQFFIFDAGTGIKELSNHLTKKLKFPISAKIFISHPHWDHINGFPFFNPFYVQGNDFEIYGADHHSISFEDLIAHQMDSVYFPVTLQQFSAKLNFHSISEEEFEIEGIHIQTMLLNHPGRCLGFRIVYKNKIICYVTDNELYLENSSSFNKFNQNKIVKFISNADILIMDATYTDEQYQQKIHWGHSCISRVIDIADAAKVKLLCLHHHDPDQFDDDIDKKVEIARDLLMKRNSNTICIAPTEGSVLKLSALTK